jgi:hypothetical protein
VFAKSRFRVIQRFVKQPFSWIHHTDLEVFARRYDELFDGSSRCGFESLHKVQNNINKNERVK